MEAGDRGSRCLHVIVRVVMDINIEYEDASILNPKPGDCPARELRFMLSPAATQFLAPVSATTIPRRPFTLALFPPITNCME